MAATSPLEPEVARHASLLPALRRFTLGLGALSLVGLLGACGVAPPPVNDGGSDAVVESLISAPTAAAIHSELFSRSCTFMTSCHSTQAHRAGLVLVDLETMCKNLINMPAQTPGAAAQKLMRVLPGDAENSFLYQKLASPTNDLGFYMNDPTLDLGDRMPQSNDENARLDPATLATLAEWINSGAVCP